MDTAFKHLDELEGTRWPPDQVAMRGKAQWKALLRSGSGYQNDMAMRVVRLRRGESLEPHFYAQPETYFTVSGLGTLTIGNVCAASDLKKCCSFPVTSGTGSTTWMKRTRFPLPKTSQLSAGHNAALLPNSSATTMLWWTMRQPCAVCTQRSWYSPVPPGSEHSCGFAKVFQNLPMFLPIVKTKHERCDS